MCEADSLIRGSIRPRGEKKSDVQTSDSDIVWLEKRTDVRQSYYRILLESLILAQDERWRRA
jgi:hypothetical protein